MNLQAALVAVGCESGGGALDAACLLSGRARALSANKFALNYGRMPNLLLNSAKTGSNHIKEARKQRDGVSRKHMEVNMEITCGVATVQAIFVNIAF